MSMQKRINMGRLPEYMKEADTGLFEDVLDDIGDMPVSDESIDRILSRTMRKAGLEMEMKTTALNETGIINSIKRQTANVETVEQEKEISAPARIRKRGILAACFALLFIGVGAFALHNGNGLDLLPEGNTPGSFVTEVSEEDKEAEERAEKQISKKALSVPDVDGLSVTEAIDILKNQNLLYEIREEFSDDIYRQKVIKTDPPCSEGVFEGDTITLFVGKGTTETYLKDSGLYERAMQLEEKKEKIMLAFSDEVAKFKTTYGFEPKLPDVYSIAYEKDNIDRAELYALEREYDSLLSTEPQFFYDYLVQKNQTEINEYDRIEVLMKTETKVRDYFRDEIERFTNEYGFEPAIISLGDLVYKKDVFDNTDLASIEAEYEKLLNYSHEDFYAYLEEKNENEIKSAKGKEQENVSAVPVDLPIFIEFPGNIEGSYTFNVYSGDKVLYTKPVICDKNAKENEVYFDTKGTGSEIYTVKVRRNGVEKKDFYYYCTVNVDYAMHSADYVKYDKEAFEKLAALK